MRSGHKKAQKAQESFCGLCAFLWLHSSFVLTFISSFQRPGPPFSRHLNSNVPTSVTAPLSGVLTAPAAVASVKPATVQSTTTSKKAVKKAKKKAKHHKKAKKHKKVKKAKKSRRG